MRVMAFSSHLERSSLLEVVEGQHVFENNSIHELQIKDKNAQQVPSDMMMYECPQPGCKQAFDSLNQLEVHLDLGSHQHDTQEESESLYDTIRRDWASKFGNISNLKLPSKSKAGSECLISVSLQNYFKDGLFMRLHSQVAFPKM